jgi:hypothetical protein
MATGAIISVALIALIFTLFNPPKAQAAVAASGAGTPGAGAMIVTTTDNTPVGLVNGVITINDSITKKVTVVAYSCAGASIALSSPHSFTYQ